MEQTTGYMQWQSEAINELVAAIVRAQLKMVPASKDNVNPYFKSKYADLPSCWEAVSCFREEGIAITQSPMEAPDGFVILDTQLSHTSGQWMRSRLKIRVAKDDPQGYGSAITYTRRYSLGCMTGLVTEEDDDGNAASRPQQPQVHETRQQNASKLKSLQQKQAASAAPGASLDVPPTADQGEGAGQPAPSVPSDDPTTKWRRILAITPMKAKDINAWWQTVPMELRQDLTEDFREALKAAAKG
jgi:hypothetical protein